MFGFDRITSDPDVLGGRACMRAMRISVSLVVNLVANGMTRQETVGEYPPVGAGGHPAGSALRCVATEETVYFPAVAPA